MSNITCDNELQMIDRLLDRLDPMWLSSSDNYSKLSEKLYCISNKDSYLELLLKHAKRATKYDTPEHIASNIRIWHNTSNIENLKQWIDKEAFDVNNPLNYKPIKIKHHSLQFENDRVLDSPKKHSKKKYYKHCEEDEDYTPTHVMIRDDKCKDSYYRFK